MGGGGSFWRSPRHYVPRDDGVYFAFRGDGGDFDEEIATIAMLLRNDGDSLGPRDDGAWFALRYDGREKSVIASEAWRSFREGVLGDCHDLRSRNDGRRFDEEIATVAALLRNDGSGLGTRGDGLVLRFVMTVEKSRHRERSVAIFLGMGIGRLPQSLRSFAMTGLMVCTHD